MFVKGRTIILDKSCICVLLEKQKQKVHGIMIVFVFLVHTNNKYLEKHIQVLYDTTKRRYLVSVSSSFQL